MAKYKIVWSEFAEWNLDQIYGYILSKSLSQRLAKRYMLKLILRVEQLQEFPFSGRKELLLTKLGKDFRYLVFKDYKIIYFVQNSAIYISDIFHSKLSPEKIKKRNL